MSRDLATVARVRDTRQGAPGQGGARKRARGWRRNGAETNSKKIVNSKLNAIDWVNGAYLLMCLLPVCACMRSRMTICLVLLSHLVHLCVCVCPSARLTRTHTQTHIFRLNNKFRSNRFWIRHINGCSHFSTESTHHPNPRGYSKISVYCWVPTRPNYGAFSHSQDRAAKMTAYYI